MMSNGTPNNLQLWFWNVNGFNNMFNLDDTIKTKIANLDVFGICETWLLYDLQTPPNFLSDFHCLQARAIRTGDRGRGSGGLLLFIKRYQDASVSVLVSGNHWIFARISFSSLHIIVGLVYLSPGLEDEEICSSLNLVLSDLVSQNPDCCLMVFGDFNARVGSWENRDKNEFFGTELAPVRWSLDTTINRRGNLLRELMEDNDMVLLNGRSSSDQPAAFTYFSG